jgi:hypothetical protein
VINDNDEVACPAPFLHWTFQADGPRKFAFISRLTPDERKNSIRPFDKLPSGDFG